MISGLPPTADATTNMSTYLLFLFSLSLVGGCLLLYAREPHRPFMSSARLMLALTGVLVFMWHVSDPPELFSDYAQAYYPAGRAIMWDISRLYARIDGCDASAVCGFVNIPVVALFFAPLSRLSLTQAEAGFAIFSLACIAVSYSVLIALTAATGWRRWAIAALFITNGPLFYSFREGNLTHVALCLLVLMLACLDRGKDFWAGALVACAAVIKLPLGLLGVYFFVKGRWRVVAGQAVALIALISVSLLWAGWDSHVTWYREAVLPFSNKSLAAFNVQSIDGLLLRLQSTAPLYDWTPIPVGSSLTWARTGLIAGFLLLSALVLGASRSNHRTKELTPVEISAVLCLALIISPISWTHYYLFLLIPFSLYLGGRLPLPPSSGYPVAMIACIFVTSPPVLFLDPAPDNSTGRLFLSHYLFGAVGVWILLCLSNWHMAHTRSRDLQISLSSSPSTVSPNRLHT